MVTDILLLLEVKPFPVQSKFMKVVGARPATFSSASSNLSPVWTRAGTEAGLSLPRVLPTPGVSYATMAVAYVRGTFWDLVLGILCGREDLSRSECTS